MVDVSRIHGPGGSSDHSSKKDKVSSEDDKFKKMMKVDKIDPEEQKKRKRREESEEEEPLEGAAPPVATPPPTATSFPQQELKIPETPLRSSSPSSPSIPTEAEEPPAIEEPTFTETLPLPPQNTQPSTRPPPAKREETQKTLSSPPPKKEEKKPIEPPKPALESHTAPMDAKGQLEKHAPSPEAAPPLMPEEENEPEDELIEEAPLLSIAQESKSSEKESQEKKEEEISPILSAQAPHEIPPPLTSIEPPSPSPAYTYLHPKVFALFETMVGVLTVVTTTGVSETTVTLNAPQFEGSAFYGAQIILQEFSTAPKAFNVQIVAPPDGIALFNANKDNLMKAFQTGNYPFKINRMDTAILDTERPLFKRKEKAEERKDEDQPQDKE